MIFEKIDLVIISLALGFNALFIFLFMNESRRLLNAFVGFLALFFTFQSIVQISYTNGWALYQVLSGFVFLIIPLSVLVLGLALFVN